MAPIEAPRVDLVEHAFSVATTAVKDTWKFDLNKTLRRDNKISKPSHLLTESSPRAREKQGYERN